MTTLCIVEDLQEIRESLVRRVSSMSGIKLLGDFSSAEEALEEIPKLDPDLVITDIGLPGMSGVECIAHLKQADCRADFLMFTVFDHDEHLFQALQIGAKGYILKGEGAKGVQRAIEEWQQGGAPMSRSIAQKVLLSFQNQSKNSDSSFDSLTPQQDKILKLLAKGLLNKEIGDQLSIAEATVKQHNVKIYQKLSVNNRSEAIIKYLSENKN